jgi:hypothetical protein
MSEAAMTGQNAGAVDLPSGIEHLARGRDAKMPASFPTIGIVPLGTVSRHRRFLFRNFSNAGLATQGNMSAGPIKGLVKIVNSNVAGGPARNVRDA